MKDISILIGGAAGDGIDAAGVIIARLFTAMGYFIYIYREYPSLIRGGHTYSLIRASRTRIASHTLSLDILVAMNAETMSLHTGQVTPQGFALYDPDDAAPGNVRGTGVRAAALVKEQGGLPIMRNTCMIGALCKAVGMTWEAAEPVLRHSFTKETDMNLAVARRGYDAAETQMRLDAATDAVRLPLVTGNDAIGLGLAAAGLDAYIGYPMTPTSGLLHFFAQHARTLSVDAVHAESEISVMLMALGFAYAGKKAAVGTSGGGFCLMTEGVSMAGMAELPVAIVVGQRTGPSTGLPTYTGQTELHFVLHAGQGEFPRLIVAPGDAEEAYFWSALALNMAWRFQVPAFIMTDKTLSEGLYNLDIAAAGQPPGEAPPLWDKTQPYARYADTANGVSPLAFPGEQGAVVKVNSYEHDAAGLTIEDAATTKAMMEKRMRKQAALEEALAGLTTVNVFGAGVSSTAVICWGSNKGVCRELAEQKGIVCIQPLVLWPFPDTQLRAALAGIKNLVCVENSAEGQLSRLLACHGITVHKNINKYDGRPFTLSELSSAF